MKEKYLKAYKILTEAKERALKQHDNTELSKLEIKKSLLEFLNFLEKIINSHNLKYSDISLFVVLDDKFIFPHEGENFYYALDKYGPTLKIKTKGLLSELVRALNLEHCKNLIFQLQDALINLHEALSLNRPDEIDERKKEGIKSNFRI